MQYFVFLYFHTCQQTTNPTFKENKKFSEFEIRKNENLSLVPIVIYALKNASIYSTSM